MPSPEGKAFRLRPKGNLQGLPGGAALARAYSQPHNGLIFLPFVGRVRRSRHPAERRAQ